MLGCWSVGRINLIVIGLFICCWSPEEDAKKYKEGYFPKSLVNRAIAKGCFGCEILLEKMSRIECFIIKKVTKEKESTSNIDEENISDFASKINSL